MSVKIGIIIGSTRPSRVGATIGKWAYDSLPKKAGVSYDLIDLAEENLPFLKDSAMPAMEKYDQESTKKWSEKIKSYDGYIWVTSEYNAAPPAPLKNAIDTVYNEWSKKPVAFVGYGGFGGARAIEHLVTSASRIGMVPLSSSGSNLHVIDVWSAIDDEGNVKAEYIRGNPEDVENNLVWWAELLKTARTEA